MPSHLPVYVASPMVSLLDGIGARCISKKCGAPGNISIRWGGQLRRVRDELLFCSMRVCAMVLRMETNSYPVLFCSPRSRQKKITSRDFSPIVTRHD